MSTPGSPPDEVTFSIMLAGGSGVGKSSIARRLLVNKFSSTYTRTVGVDLLCVPLPGLSGSRSALMQLWDPSHVELHGSWPDAVRGAHAQAVLLVINPARPQTLREADEWLLRARVELNLASGDAWLLAHCHDRRGASPPLGPHQLDAYCVERGLMGWRYTTAKHGRSIHDVFEQVLEALALAIPVHKSPDVLRVPLQSAPPAIRLRMAAAEIREAALALDTSLAESHLHAVAAEAARAAASCPGFYVDGEVDGLAAEWEECARLSKALWGNLVV